MIELADPEVLSLDGYADGLWSELPESVYHERRREIANKSGLDLIARAPAAFQAWLSGRLDDDDRKAFAFGKAAHMAILEPERFATRYVIAPDFGPQRKTDACSSEDAKENKLRRRAWMAAHADVEVLDSESAIATLEMTKEIAADPYARTLLGEGVSEMTVLWTHKDSGMRCKSRLDHWNPALRTIVDVKTTTDARIEHVRRVAESFTYYRQDAMERMALEAHGIVPEHFAFVFLEKTPPYLLNIFELDASDVERGREEVRDCLLLHAECLKEDVWPRYPSLIQPLKLRPWKRDF